MTLSGLVSLFDNPQLHDWIKQTKLLLHKPDNATQIVQHNFASLIILHMNYKPHCLTPVLHPLHCKSTQRRWEVLRIYLRLDVLENILI
jgi:hypothetical protein